MKRTCGPLLAIALLLPSLGYCQATAPTTLPAFPGAEGFGGYTSGGRGGDAYEVTNLDDAGPGSFRDAVSTGNRTIVFRVSGTIDLKSPLRVRASNLTIAGQTAPGDGICVRGYTFDITGHDVVVRFVRSRLGDEDKQESDGITLGNGVRNVILDHCSATWSVDEALSTAGNIDNATIQWCLIGEALNHSIHAKGAHGYGSLARADGAVSWLHNLWAHNNSRNPRLGDNYGRGSHPQFDVRYNVMYDYGEICSGLTQGIFTANYVGNYIRPGPSSRARTPIHMGPVSTIQFYLRDNIFEGNDALTADNSRFIDSFELEGKPVASVVNEPFPAPPVAPMTAKQAYEAVLASVGASLPKRDAVDARIVQTVRDRTGTLIDSQNQVGGYPELKSLPAPKDSDHDGMPDEWETKNGFDPNDPADAKADADHDGYTNLEEYLNGTNPKQFVDYRDAKNNFDALTADMIGR